jgi:predicted transcriptional regulator
MRFMKVKEWLRWREEQKNRKPKPRGIRMRLPATYTAQVLESLKDNFEKCIEEEKLRKGNL